MPRKKRDWIPQHFYHITCRGNRRDPLFRDTSDFKALLQILHQLQEKYPFEIASYCFMTNHYHLQLRSSEIPLSKLMSLINKRYADYYNTKYGLTGHVFEKRYFAKICYGREGMLAVSHYIHLNPVEASIVTKPEHYPWSSYHLYRFRTKPPVFMNLDSLLEYYEGAREERKGQYCRGF